MTDDSPASPPAPAVTAITLKLPPFWPTNPEVWFAQVQAQFITRGISAQRTMFDYVVSSLSPEFAMEVRDLLLTPPTDHPYDTLKTQLIKHTTASEQRKLQQLISGEELGDRKPTQLLRRMQQLLGNKLASGADSTSFLRELFLQRLPANVRMVLASADSTTTLDKLAEMADKVMEVATPVVAAVGHAHTESSVEVKQLRKEVAHLTDLVTALTTSNTPSARHSRSNFVVVPHPRTPFSLLTLSVGIMPSLGKQLRSARNHATGETPRPDPSGDGGSRPYSHQSPILCYGYTHWYTIPGGYWI